MPGDRDPTSVVEALKKRCAPVVTLEVLPKSPALSARYGASDNRIFLVRPDGYVAFKAAARDLALVEEYLAHTLTPAAKMM
jgi:hypothetical protein